MKVLKKTVSLLTQGLLIFSISLATLLLIPLIPVLGEWYQLAVVQSASMEPYLKVGSLAIYKAQKSYFVGEVIAYHTIKTKEQHEKLIIHRIASKSDEINPQLYFTQGDANEYLSTEPIFEHQIKGKLIGSIPTAGYVVNWFQSKLGISVVILTLLLFLILDEINQPPAV